MQQIFKNTLGEGDNISFLLNHTTKNSLIFIMILLVRVEYFETHLNNQTVSLVNNSIVVCVFVNDTVRCRCDSKAC